MTPSDLELLIHCHVSPAPHPRLDAPAIQEGLRKLLHHDIICPTAQTGVYNATPRGKAHIEQLRALPFPEQAYIDYKGDKI